MSDKQYLTITEAAGQAGITPQAVYKRLKTNLQPFTKELNGKKMLHIDALKILKPTETTNTVEDAVQPGSMVELIESLKRTVEILTSQLAVKDRQINDLNDRLQQSLTNAGMNHYVQARQIEAPGVKRSWLDRVFKRDQ